MVTVFLVLGVVGVVLMAVALIFGDLFDGLGLSFLDTDFFSTAAIAGFLGAFGFVGAGVHEVTGLGIVSIPAGLAVGVLFAWGALRLTKVLKRGERSESWNEQNMIGTDATVVTPIPADGFGEVTLNVRGQVMKLNARSELALEAGTKVWVSGVVSATAVQVSPN